MEKKFKWLWADHGDDISRQYAGTGALKSGFTRTGKRTTWGLLDDGVKSVVRYYVDNFSDGRKQDAADLVTGNYSISKGVCHGAKLAHIHCPCFVMSVLLQVRQQCVFPVLSLIFVVHS